MLTSLVQMFLRGTSYPKKVKKKWQTMTAPDPLWTVKTNLSIAKLWSVGEVASVSVVRRTKGQPESDLPGPSSSCERGPRLVEVGPTRLSTPEHKIDTQGKHHGFMESVQQAMSRELTRFPVQAFLKTYENRKTHWQKCVDAGMLPWKMLIVYIIFINICFFKWPWIPFTREKAVTRRLVRFRGVVAVSDA